MTFVQVTVAGNTINKVLTELQGYLCYFILTTSTVTQKFTAC